MQNLSLAEKWPELFKPLDDPDWECRGSMHQPFEADIRAKARRDAIMEALERGRRDRAAVQAAQIAPFIPRRRRIYR